MHNVIAFVKKHPVVIGVAVFAVGLIIVLSMAGGGGSQQVVSAQPTDNTATLAGANAQIALGQIQGQVAALQIDAQKTVALQTSSDALSATRSTLEMQNNANILQAYTIVHGQDTTMNTTITTNQQNTSAAVAITQTQANAAVNIASVNADAAKFQASIDLQKTLGAATGSAWGYTSDQAYDLAKSAQSTALQMQLGAQTGSAFGYTTEQAYNLAENKIRADQFSQTIDLQKIAVQKTGSPWGISAPDASAIGIINAVKS